MNNRYDITGQKFGRLTVKSFSHQDGYRHNNWLCLCDCGNTRITTTRSLKSGNCKSCGCLREELYQGIRDKWNGFGYISKSFWWRIRDGAVSRNLLFEITKEFAFELFKQQDAKCVLTGLDISLGKNSHGLDRTASLDRIDSTKGYVESNVQWVHKDINVMKWDFTTQKFFELVKLVCNHNKLTA